MSININIQFYKNTSKEEQEKIRDIILNNLEDTFFKNDGIIEYYSGISKN